MKNSNCVLLVIDNYDSFTYNLVQYFGQLGVKQKVFRNDALAAEEALAMDPDGIVLSPGPKTPAFAGNSLAMMEAFAGRKPILGVCLGHQCIGCHFGGDLIPSSKLLHGKTSLIRHKGTGLFEGLPSPFPGTRYHSLLLNPETLPPCLEIIADTADREIMGVKHRQWPIWGVQFHPESLATKNGMRILQNFLSLAN